MSNGFTKYIEELRNIDCSNFPYMNGLFGSLYSLKKITISKMPTTSYELTQSFINCKSLISAPTIDTSKAKGFMRTFWGCVGLKNVPVYDVSGISNSSFSLYNTFTDCPSLTNDSLNNIMQMCINATNKVAGSDFKTLKSVGLSEIQSETCQSLSNYNAFIAAGWTTGY